MGKIQFRILFILLSNVKNWLQKIENDDFRVKNEYFGRNSPRIIFKKCFVHLGFCKYVSVGNILILATRYHNIVPSYTSNREEQLSF